MKAILVVEMPNECIECSQYESFDCRILDKNVCLCITQCRRHENCPLKPLPKRFGEDIEDDYAKGWNDCLDFIERESNG